ncbi:carboxypeptidase M isoform X2 [Hippocampus comes]|nr:PREDICTED: carboxypeptidase M isoform X2 [Hippocampus comes]XP_019753076.1 PREDICTED: carboxypeptidase M isoform X2 [Hippocampus comes]XP_019753077.1 PREDICTED: carboxypeptidase M isoform X2 [Hippocampus comes]XP_019753078.1 PREDICTED: carboxypeptidase M isoform X2 [Hippocampus comes]XP_019753080.1 PREDICTED: carboxypeptidase M isoform X2 [Hippocampus comes]
MRDLGVFLLALFPAAMMLDFRYHSNREMESYLLRVNASNPDIAHLYSIGRSVAGQRLWVLALGLSPHRHALGVPEFKYVANMHGNEVLGRELLLQLIDDLVQGYRGNESWATRILNSTRVHFLPTMNPDGFDQADTNCYLSQGRFNRNGVDLNRNFPDAFAGPWGQRDLEDAGREAEVRAVMGWLKTETFVLSANLHGGALVASYAYDNSNGGGELVGRASLTPDDDVFVHLAKVYSHNHASMRQGGRCGDQAPFREGITNGYQWYPLAGGMQDYNYVWAGCLEVTLEVSCCKFPPAGQLPALWADNRKSLLAFIRQAHLGVKGRVLDCSGAALHNAVVEVSGRRNVRPFATDKHGEYYRLLLPGNYTFTVTYPGYEVLTETFFVPYGPERNSALTHDFLLRRVTVATADAAPSSARSLLSPAVTSAWMLAALGMALAFQGLIS